MATTTDADATPPVDAHADGESAGATSRPGALTRALDLARSPFGLGLLAVAAVGLVWRAAYILAFKREPGPCGTTLLCGDAIYYNGQAGVNAAGRFFEDPVHAGFPAADHPPMTALVLTPVSWLTDNSILAQRFTMALIGTITVVVLGLLGRKLAGSAAGIATAALAAANPNLWMNDGLVMSESVATLGIALSLLGLYRFRERPSWGRAAALGALLGLTMLARAEMALFVPLAVLPVALLLRDLSLGQRVLRFLAVGAVAVGVLVPWSAWNATRFRQPVLLSTNDGITLVGTNCDTTYYTGGIGFWDLGCAFAADAKVADRDQLDQSQVSAAYRDQAVSYVRANKGALPSVVWHRVLRVWNLHQPHQMVWLNQGEGRETWASWWGVWWSWAILPFAVWGALLLRRAGVPLSGAGVVVIGRSQIVGRPLSILLSQKGVDATVTLAHSRTADLVGVCREADIIVAAAGQAKMITADHVKPGAAVLDVGISRTEAGIVGDVDFEGVSTVAGALTPMPGGTGPMTIACLMENTLAAARLLGAFPH